MITFCGKENNDPVETQCEDASCGVCYPDLPAPMEPPMGASQWKNHGVKYGYWEFFEHQLLAQMGEKKGLTAEGMREMLKVDLQW